jgi:hypothetical protein
VHRGLCHVQDQASGDWSALRRASSRRLLIISGENKTFVGGEEYLKQKGLEVIVLQSEDCQRLMAKFIKEKPDDWNEDIGEQGK